MVMGGGAFVVFMLIIGVLIYAMNYTSSDKIFNAADGDYRGGSYVQAIQKYHTFIDKFPSDDRASLRGFASAWQSSGKRPPTAQLVRGAAGGTGRSRQDGAGELVQGGSFRFGLALDEDRRKPGCRSAEETDGRTGRQGAAGPRHGREAGIRAERTAPESKLADARASLGIAEHDLARGNELDKALAAMQKATKELKTADAYAACGVLLHQYPDMTNDPRLKKMLLAVSGRNKPWSKPSQRRNTPQPTRPRRPPSAA